MTNLAHLVAKVEEIQDASPADWDAARAYVLRHAPDVADILLGLQQTRDHDQHTRLQRGLRGVR